MPDLDKLVSKLREELDAEKAESERRHDELLAELRRSQPAKPGRSADRMRRGYEASGDPAEVRAARKGRKS